MTFFKSIFQEQIAVAFYKSQAVRKMVREVNKSMRSMNDGETSDFTQCENVASR